MKEELVNQVKELKKGETRRKWYRKYRENRSVEVNTVRSKKQEKYYGN